MSNKTIFRKNQIINLKIDDINDLGFGVGRYEGIVVFVADTVPGDVVRAKIIKVNSSYLICRTEQYVTKSPLRVVGRCENGACKSCAYRHISYTEEAKRKEEGVRRLFSTGELSGITTLPIITSPREVRYRNKAQYPIALIDGEYKVGFFAPRSHRVTPVSDCPLTPKVFSDIVLTVTDFMKDLELSVYDEESGEGLCRHIYLRRGEVSGEVLVTLVINGDSIPHPEAFADRIHDLHPEVVGVLLNKNKEKTNVVLGDEYVTLWGRDYIYDTLAGVELKITAPAFYQVNHGAAELLYKKARELAKPEKSDTLLDLYCGAGSIGLSMAEDVGELIGIEIVDSAVRCATENAERSGITNAHFFTGDAADTEKLLSNAQRTLGRKIKPDIVILDPPRGGCDERLIRFVADLSPKRVVYISCNPKTLARDTVLFRALGYDTREVQPVDLFPMTGHVETIVCLNKQ